MNDKREKTKQEEEQEFRAEIPLHGGRPALRPAEAFMAEQAAMVDPRRAAFARLALAPEHVTYLPARAEPATEAAERPVGVKHLLEADRPSPDYEVPLFERPRKPPAREDAEE